MDLECEESPALRFSDLPRARILLSKFEISKVNGRIPMVDYKKGAREAEILLARAPGKVEASLSRARESRARWSIRLFKKAKRRFLDGFIARLEEHQRKAIF
ncbi:hypothetical protein ACYOEI_18415 [Singulisphaera rosea]